ncbi:MAG: MogA/MoaB family molybdenum cofactor biosynthesis protein [Candidatus Helarchaeota archaeon]
MTIEHKKNDNKYKNLIFAVVIVSDSRYRQFIDGNSINDLTIPIIKEIVLKQGHKLISAEFVPDEQIEIKQKINSLIKKYNPHIIITSGGTGINERDITIEVMSKLYEKELPGFGELFRALSYKEIGVNAILSRANAGIYKNTLIFNLPGNPNAVKLALEEIIIPIASHSTAMLR